MPKVAIGLPVYNGERYLEAALDAIQAQTFTDYEVVICDNASTDRTEAICRAYEARDQRIRYYRNPANIGAAPNFNRTFELADGEYFKWFAADDLITPDYLEQCVAALDRNPDAVLCYTRVLVIDDDGKVVGEHLVELESSRRSSSQRPLWRIHPFFADLLPGFRPLPGFGTCSDAPHRQPHRLRQVSDRRNQPCVAPSSPSPTLCFSPASTPSAPSSWSGINWPVGTTHQRPGAARSQTGASGRSMVGRCDE